MQTVIHTAEAQHPHVDLPGETAPETVSLSPCRQPGHLQEKADF